ncbi:hypothetical protein LSTR_LSTR005323 [Laodelphax striatellus]|uniref:Uncharacterized protein n=1 Tax=Laodelphax striatellus TaxID=195883 RepID=A0A482WIQ4_LAOST|nr:hypothetical protein LSTR_LSTR015244 [Laodelphax striatellus]RZF41861.1 hypothetical protein LSTR_LSTR005323 [Laodelphax striatellus]
MPESVVVGEGLHLEKVGTKKWIRMERKLGEMEREGEGEEEDLKRGWLLTAAREEKEKEKWVFASHSSAFEGKSAKRFVTKMKTAE